MARKTKMMLRVEELYQRPVESLLPEMINENGLSATAGELGISKATLGYSLLKLRIEVRRIALAPGGDPGSQERQLKALPEPL